MYASTRRTGEVTKSFEFAEIGSLFPRTDLVVFVVFDVVEVDDVGFTSALIGLGVRVSVEWRGYCHVVSRTGYQTRRSR
jgi:hypothetical protein